MSPPLHARPARELQSLLRSGELSAREVVEEAIERHRQVDPTLRAFATPLLEQAQQRAQELDRRRSADGAPPPLFGLTFSIKENIATQGQSQTLGIRSRLPRPAGEDATLVQTLKQQGGVVLGKSNVPLLLLAMETHNDIYGTTANPWDLRRSPGGSSGGDAAAVATGQVHFGLGTDIGGSIRNPAAWCGVVGLKPTVGRWSLRGVAPGVPGQEFVRSTPGPLARDVGDLQLLLQAMDPALQHRLDPRVCPLPWREQALDLQGLRVGYYEDDGVFSPSPAIRRVLRRAADLLRQAGATVVELTLPHSWELVELYFGALSADGAATMTRLMGEQPITPQLKSLRLLAQSPDLGRMLLGQAAGLAGQKRLQRVLGALGEKRVEHLWRMATRRNELARAELEAWDQAGVDVVIGPPSPTPPALLNETHDWSLGAWHTMRYNLLDMPAGVLPVGSVLAGDLPRQGPADRFDQKAARFEQDSLGLPLALQVIARPWQDEKAVALMAALESLHRGLDDLPRLPVTPRAA